MARYKNKNTKSTNYFNEKEMNILVKEYKMNNSEQTFKKIEPGINQIINGMINKEFSYNSLIKNNKNDAVSECTYEILRSLKNYDPDRGRLYAYVNRIVKNTLLKYTSTHRKYKNKEIFYTELVKKDMEESVNAEENATRLGLETSGTDSLDIMSDDSIIHSVSNITLSIKDSLILYYRYLKYIEEAVSYYMSNMETLSELLNEIKFDPTVKFDLEKSMNSTIVSKNILYRNLLFTINEMIKNIISWIETTYNINDKSEPEEYDGNMSPRAIGYIRKFVNTSLKRQKINNYFDTTDLIEFMQYIIKCRNGVIWQNLA